MNNCQICGTKTHSKTTCSSSCKRQLQLQSIPEKECPFPACGKIFQPQSPRSKYCAPKHTVACSECSSEATVISAKRAPFYCKPCSKKESDKRRAESNKNRSKQDKAATKAKVEKTNLERYGVRRPQQSEEIREKTKETNLLKYGSEHHMQNKEIFHKAIQTNLEKYGVPHAAQAEETKRKTEQSNLEKYGAEHHMLTKEGRENYKKVLEEKYGEGVTNPAHVPGALEKARRTNIEKYGTPHTFSSETIRDKGRKTLLERYGVDNYAKTNSYKSSMIEWSLEMYGVEHHLAAQEIRKKIIQTVQEKYGVSHHMKDPAILEKTLKSRAAKIQESPYQRVSKVNRRFAERLNENFAVEVSFEQIVENASFDLYIEEKDLYIDIHPTITHNTETPFSCLIKNCKKNCPVHKKLNPDYHYRRAEIARRNNIDLLQVYEWEDLEKINSLLSSKLEDNWKKFSARKLALKPISQTTANMFLLHNHIQGAAKGQSHCYGLYKENRLLAVATFGRSRFKAKEEYEWIRYAVKRGYIIHGASSKLWRAFQADADPTSVISYVDFNHTTRKNVFLSSLGFFENSPTGPSLIWHNIQENKKVKETSLLAQGADRLLGTSYGSREESGLNNHDIMLLEGYLPVYTAGNRVFRWKKEPSGPTTQ